jgi:hypothetical protein
MNFKLNKMSRSNQNHTVRSQINGLPGSAADNLNILNPSMKEILKLENNDSGEVDLLKIYKLERNINVENDPNLDKKLMHVQRLSTRKKEIGRMRSKLMNSNTKLDKYQEEVNIDRGKAEKMAENIFKRRVKHMNKSREKEVSKSNSEIMDAKPNLIGSSKSFLVRLSSQGGHSLNQKDSKENKSENKQNILNRVNERKVELSPENYRRRNNVEKPEDKTKNIGRRNNSNSNSNYVSQNNYSSKSYSNIRDNKRENKREAKNNKVEIDNKNINLNNRRGNDQKVDNQNKRTYKNTIPISNYNNNQINKASSSSHIVYSSQTNKNPTNQSNRGIPPNQAYQKIPINNSQRGNRSNIPLPNPSKNNMRKELSYQKLPEKKNDKSIDQIKAHQPIVIQNGIKSNYTRKPVEEHKNAYQNNSSVTVTIVGRRRNETNQNNQSNVKVEPKKQPQKVEAKYQKVVVNRNNGNERAKTEDPSKVIVRRRNNNNENKSIIKEDNRKVVVNTSTTSGRRKGPQ